VETPPVEAPPAGPGPSLELEQLREAWQRTILPVVTEKSIPIGTALAEARPVELDDDRLTLEFSPNAAFHRQLAEDPKNAGYLQEALYEVTGRRLALAFAEGEAPDTEHELHHAEQLGPEEVFELMKDTFDAREVEET
jgi:hypothetical protein